MKKSPVHKPTKPIHQRLIKCWWLWLMLVLVGHPLALMTTTQASGMMAVMMKLIILTPALALTPAVMRGNQPAKLIYLSIITLTYLGVSGVMALIRYYELAPMAVWLMYVLELLLLCVINHHLFILLRRLPPMHKQVKS
ncbi:hypothetical protein [Moraxella oculi]|uniref:DUF2919 domain-containing protein n=1 Tax=Moraxella oculi TaxID=2940516 RepID=A0ABW8UAL2_9GAMM